MKKLLAHDGGVIKEGHTIAKLPVFSTVSDVRNGKVDDYELVILLSEDGFKTYFYDANDSSSADNGDEYLVSTDSERRYVLTQNYYTQAFLIQMRDLVLAQVTETLADMTARLESLENSSLG
ncbi:hypothetical protein DYBT9275_02790 [Dyadobacter sp. CECT 9275]|uniref:Uncharacterized protein n=1 Tax=Dyadobacter helix TaxID=2822344 RepID=A0A916JD98_9BACT|nr:hypothetical protein [Dyadobacter sp. CECT 9275]CAG5002034.1 hypothetical protein DYBT9275_02790 [Dyadobacter sp. CECT 9275]